MSTQIHRLRSPGGVDVWHGAARCSHNCGQLGRHWWGQKAELGRSSDERTLMTYTDDCGLSVGNHLWWPDAPEDLGFVRRDGELIGSLVVAVAVRPPMTKIETHVMAVRFYFRMASR